MAARCTLPTISLCLLVISVLVMHEARAQLLPNFYDEICPQALPAIKAVVERAVAQEPRMGASLLRLHFHDCFVNGCDGSILLDDAPEISSEKSAGPNNNSARGFEVVDQIKLAVNSACYNNVVSCADILAVAARDSVVALGGPSYQVLLGRRDARTANQALANTDIPRPDFNFSGLLSNFQSHGLNLQDLVALSGAHTMGFGRCLLFRTRIYNETNIDSGFAASLQEQCPFVGNDDNLAGLDDSPTSFDIDYFQGLVEEKGVLHSDQQLFKGDGSASDGIVKYYIRNPNAFRADFGASMVKMGNISPLTGTDGEIRKNCRVVN